MDSYSKGKAVDLNPTAPLAALIRTTLTNSNIGDSKANVLDNNLNELVDYDLPLNLFADNKTLTLNEDESEEETKVTILIFVE